MTRFAGQFCSETKQKGGSALSAEKQKINAALSPAFFFLRFYLFILRERERERERGGGAERVRDKNLKQAPGSELSAQSHIWGSNSQTMRL